MKYFIFEGCCNIKSLWVKKDSNIYSLNKEEIARKILNNIIVNAEDFYKVFNFENFRFNQDRKVLDLNLKEDCRMFSEAVNGCYEEGEMVRAPFVKEVSLSDAYNFIKLLYLEFYLENNNIKNVLDNSFIKDISKACRKSFDLEV